MSLAVKFNYFLLLLVFTTGWDCQVSADDNVGCLFERDLCENYEVCTDDNAFGRCQIFGSYRASNPYRYELDSNTLDRMLLEMSRLFVAGYHWKDEYTQCSIKQLLYIHRFQLSYDPGLCSRMLRLTSPITGPVTAIDLTLNTDPSEVGVVKYATNSGGQDARHYDLEQELNEKKRSSFNHRQPDLQSDLQSQDFWNKFYLEEFRKAIDAQEDDQKTDLQDNLPISQVDLASDLNQRPIYHEGGTDWVPVDKEANTETTDEKSISETENEKSDGAGVSSHSQLVMHPSDVINFPDGDTKFTNYWRSVDESSETGDNNNQNRDLIDDDIDLIDAWNLPRQHRYDTKKPGPYYNIHEIDLDELPMTEDERLIENKIDNADLLEQFAWPDDIDEKGQQEQYNGADDFSGLKFADSLESKSGQQEEVAYGNPVKLSDEKHTDGDKIYHPVQEGPVQLDPNLKDVSDVKQVDTGKQSPYEAIDASRTYIKLNNEKVDPQQAYSLVTKLQELFQLPTGTFSNIRTDKSHVTFKVNPNIRGLNASEIANAIGDFGERVKKETGFSIEASGIGDKSKLEVISTRLTGSNHRLAVITLTLCGAILAALVSGAIVFYARRNATFRQKLAGFISHPDEEASADYQDLCRQRMQSKSNEKAESIHVAPTGVHTTSKLVSKLSQQSSDSAQPSPPSRSSTSSWSEEPVASNMDISTGHMILSYMEDHLKNKDRLDREWEALCAYEADPSSTNAANLPQNAKKNRYPDVLPYDHSRVILNDLANINSSDYINANTITDHDPRNPAYICTQGPLPHTTADFWQMIWEQGSVIIVMLTRLMENGVSMCHRYWPEEGSEVYHTYEVHLVSEHIWCDDYLVRSFYLKNFKTNETRTVTHFHFLSWPENSVPGCAKAILEFRRKVNKSYRGRSCPIVVHCSDGIGRSGTYCLIDMVLNRMAKGAKEIDIAATLEHIRDQRMGSVKTKAQFEYVLMAIAEEVQAILKALSQ